MNPDLFIEIHDWGGHIGNIYWCNSEPSPHLDNYSRRLCVYWGCFLLHPPKPEISYGKFQYPDFPSP